MKEKRVLIVDDDKSILRMLDFGLRKLGPDYRIITADDIFTAMEHIEGTWFDLIIIDYMMPVMTGVDLARAVRRISPDTQIVLMTAYGTSKLRHTTDSLRFDGYLNKPFNMDQLRDMVRHTTSRAQLPGVATSEANATASDAVDRDVSIEDESDAALSANEHLQKLQINAGARAILLINAQGDPLHVVGQINNTKVNYICSLVAANYYSPAELSNLLDNKNLFKSNFYEGDAYNLYVCDVNGKFLLAVVFDVKLRPGVIWFYTKQTAAALSPLIK